MVNHFTVTTCVAKVKKKEYLATRNHYNISLTVFLT